eukprot:COSAG01_NODE_1696_length_9461_cov_8.289010_12_plen_149_part_00
MPEWGSRWVDGIPAELRAVARMRCAVASGHGQWAARAVRAACDGAVGALVAECERRAEVDAAVTAVVDAVVAEEERARRCCRGASSARFRWGARQLSIAAQHDTAAWHTAGVRGGGREVHSGGGAVPYLLARVGPAGAGADGGGALTG